MLKIYNTLTREKQEFKPIHEREVKVYHCGPTVYNYAHIGNLKTYVGNDIITRVLRFLGYNVTVTMNITDIDDKTIRDSIAAGEDLTSFTKKYTKHFIEDINKLNIVKPNNLTPISEVIPEMTRMINTLLRRKTAYLSDDGSVYFDISKFKKYGKLANIDMSGMKSSVRIDNDEYDKENAADFALWKAWTKADGDNFWEEEFEIPEEGEEGKTKKVILKGRPGWHIECSACNMKHFGPQIDLHTGGIDNLFPHHQNELAQTEACTRKPFSKYWMHHGHLTVDGRKMSKSAHNFYTLEDLENNEFKDTKPEILFRAVRLSFINGKYRDSIDFSHSKVEGIFKCIESLDQTIKLLKLAIKNDITTVQGVSRVFREHMQDVIAEYIQKLEDDINMPEAIAIFFKFQTFVNKGIKDNTFAQEELISALDMFKTFDQVLGIMDFSVGEETEEVPSEITEKLEARTAAKKNKDFVLADKLRLEIEEAGYKVVDDRSGVRVEKS